MTGKGFELFRNLWIIVRIKAPPFVQSRIIPWMYAIKEVATLLARPYLYVRQLQGQGQAGALTATCAGSDSTISFLKRLLFIQQPVAYQIKHIPVWRCCRMIDSLSTDLVIIEGSKYLVHGLPRGNAFVLPEYVRHILDVCGSWEDVRGRLSRSVRRNELRLMRKYGYEYELSHDVDDLETFYYQMYLPTMHDRHGELSWPLSFSELRQYFRYGMLFKIKRDGNWVSGVVCYPEQDVLIAKALGIRNADSQLIQEGATAATYYAGVHWAHQQGYHAVNFLGTKPFLDDGLFQHKRKWGTKVFVPSHLHRRVWLKVQRVTPAVSMFLQENPFVVVDRVGKLHGLIFVDDLDAISSETREGWLSRYETPGLNSLIVRSVDSLMGPNNDAAGLVVSITSGCGSETI